MTGPTTDSQPAGTTAPATPATRRRRWGVVRHLCELGVCLAIAVTLFRAFEVEGYMISTGSMAPSLLGYHKRVVCPTCEFQFAFGVSFDESVQEMVASSEHSTDAVLVDCPNCGQRSIDVSGVPRNQGDQLLVDKQAFTLRDPRRWEMAVFRNPQNPTQVYVKRVAGLPGERIQVRHGDVYINGALQRKNLELQRAMRIPVFDLRFNPDDESWNQRWREPGTVTHWNRRGDRFVHGSTQPELHVLEYVHWLRSGGRHETWVPLDEIPGSFQTLADVLNGSLPFDLENSRERLRFERETRRLICTGVLPAAWADRLRAISADPAYTQAVTQLEHDSHEGFVADVCGYNDPDFQTHDYGVVDMMLECEVQLRAADGLLMFELSDGREDYRCELDLEQSEVRLLAGSSPQAIRSSRLPERVLSEPFCFTMSLIDRQLLVAMDDQTIFDAVPLDPLPDDHQPPRRPIRIMSVGAAVEVSGLSVFRDVYYTRGKGLHGVDEPFELDEGEFFMLGDNSPVSSDSRSWPAAPVERSLLVGRPLLVHLPSRPGVLRWKDYSARFRIPDLSRIRYIR